ncbi:hypothetical protein SNE40_000555 [Patella caerulea]|uniref:Axonemal dynein light chain domain-containing protein 1 n=1 Tax=Patella caerulea TaxID=87958 RepID=A0AAN8KAS7_PATCE
MSCNSTVVGPTPTPQTRSGAGTPKSTVAVRDPYLPEIRTSDNMIDRTKPLPTSLQSDFLPEDILFVLTQPPPAKDKLGPAPKLRNLNTTSVQSRPAPANVWNHKRREKFKHLTENTTCVCGAGRDISFLYDVPLPEPVIENPEKLDGSIIRNDFDEKPKHPLQLPDTLVPDEYHIVKNRGVMGIEFHEDKYSTHIEDHEKHLMVFPSMKPTSRFEVLQLKKVLDDLLEKVGANDVDVDVRGPTQMHNLLELIKKEQNIYNVIFHELIRQVHVECSERGELLATLRKKYSDLLNRIPSQIKSLHEEVMAQRALDRRLTEELMRFKNTIGVLTSELTEVKEHDKRVTREAQKAQEDLKFALSEAQKNSSLLSEYHDLYELQRQRLEHQVVTLTSERELWSSAAYSLAMKVTEECQLTTAKRLHVSEKAWAKLAHHFTILLSDKDTEVLTVIQTHVEQWRDLIEDFNLSLKQREEDMKDNLCSLKSGIERWSQDFQRTCFNKEGMLVRPPDEPKMKILQSDIRAWEEILGKESETFGGDLFLSNLDALMNIRKEMEGWTDASLRVFGRHRGLDGKTHHEQTNMMNLNEEVDELLKQFNNRVTGENGVATGVIHLMNAISGWESRITTALNGSLGILDSEWGVFFLTLEDWIISLNQSIEFISTTQCEADRSENRPHTSIDIHDTVRKTQKWMTTASSAIDSEDAKLVDQVSTLHSEMVQWMVQLLLRLAPDREDHSEEARQLALIGTSSIPQLHEQVKQLFDKLELFSNYVTLCCDGIVIDNTQRRQDLKEDNADNELRDLHRLRAECDSWIHTAQILTSQLMEEPIHELFPAKSKEKQKKPQSGYSDKTSFSDKEKLEEQDNQQNDEQEQKEEIVMNEKLDVSPSKPTSEQDASESLVEQTQPVEPVKSEPVVQNNQSDEVLEKTSKHKDRSEIVPVTESEMRQESLEKIGTDENTHIQTLHPSLDKPPAPPVSKVKETPNTKKAYEALAAVDTLQKQLINTEERAQEAEDRASMAELELAETQERVRALERKLGTLTDSNDVVDKPVPQQSSVANDTKVAATSSAVSTTVKDEKKSDIKLKRSSAKKRK